MTTQPPNTPLNADDNPSKSTPFNKLKESTDDKDS